MNTVAFVLITTLAVSYGWGMRGSLIGGEKGTLVPGALLGLMLALFTGNEIITSNFWVFAGAGALAMTYGGTETYGETIGIYLDRGAEYFSKKLALRGFILKGALWFGVASGIIAMAFSSVTGEVYKWYDFVILFGTFPLTGHLGYLLFNTPYNKAEKKFPKIYFSRTRREEWGRNVILLAEILVFAALRSDVLTMIMATVGALSGGIGWVIAIKLFELAKYPMKNGKQFFGILGQKGLVAGWKTMEFTLGAVGGLGISLGFVFCKPLVDEICKTVSSNGALFSSFAGHETLSVVLCFVCIFAVLLLNVFAGIMEAKGKKLNFFIWDMVERPFYNNIPIMLILLGSLFTARIAAFFMVYLVMIIKCAFERFAGFKVWQQAVWDILFVTGAAVILVYEFRNGGFSAKWVVFLCCVPYFVLDSIHSFRKEKREKMKQNIEGGASVISQVGLVPIFFVVQIAALCLIAFYVL